MEADGIEPGPITEITQSLAGRIFKGWYSFIPNDANILRLRLESVLQ
jgi:hypothetical protein